MKGLSTFLDSRRIEWKETRTSRIQIVGVTDPETIWRLAVEFNNFQKNFEQ